MNALAQAADAHGELAAPGTQPTSSSRLALARASGWVDGRKLALVSTCGGLAVVGWLLNAAFDFPALRAQVAVICGAFACTFSLAERWSVDEERMASGALCALAHGLATGIAASI